MKFVGSAAPAGVRSRGAPRPAGPNAPAALRAEWLSS